MRRNGRKQMTVALASKPGTGSTAKTQARPAHVTATQASRNVAVPSARCSRCSHGKTSNN